MKLGGIGNLGFTPAPKARDAKSSSPEKSESSFGDVLLQPKAQQESKSEAKVQDQPKNNKPEQKTETKLQTKAEPIKSEAKAEGKQLEAQQTQGEVAAQSVEATSLPTQPSAPALSGPVQDRVLNATPDSVFNTNILKTPGAKAQQEEGVDSLTRRVVWNDFLRKMKDDLGVDAEDVLEAFSTLSNEELAQPPQETVNAVVQALGLDGSQAQMARKYFTELVDKTKSKSMGEELETSGRQINLTLMSQREMERKALARSLDKMNQSFFIKNPQMAKAAAQQLPLQQPVQQNQNGEELMVLGPNGLVPASSLNLPMQTAEAVPAPIPQAAPGSPMAALEKWNSKSAKPLEQKNTIDEMVRQFLAPQARVETLKSGEMQAMPMAAASAGMPAQVPVTPAAAIPVAPQTAAMDTLQGLLTNLAGDQTQSDGSEEDSSEFTSDASYLNHTLGNQEHLKGALAKGAELQGELGKVQSAQPMTVPELVDKAQIMLHEGGGEMKVTMSPDGLGEVALRVSVNEGKVQVQMITESDEAKRMIERHMGDLKSQLHNNNLQMDTIKIDTATNLGKQLEQQYQDAQRQQAHQTLEQFRQDQQGWRRSFFDVPSARQYKGQSEGIRDVAAPGTVSGSGRKGNANRRLDLVA